MNRLGIPSAEELWKRHEELVLEVFESALGMLREETTLPTDESEISTILYLKTREANFQLNVLNRGLPHPPIPDASIPPRSTREIGSSPTKKRPDFQCPYRDMSATDQEHAYVSYSIECKRLGRTTNTGWNLNRNYVSEGIVRFVAPEHSYGKGTRAGAMIGYVQNMEVPAITSEINTWIDQTGAWHLVPIDLSHNAFDTRGLLEIQQELVRQTSFLPHFV